MKGKASMNEYDLLKSAGTYNRLGKIDLFLTQSFGGELIFFPSAGPVECNYTIHYMLDRN